MKILNINSFSNKLFNKASFGSQYDKHKTLQDKREYIDSKTSALNDFGFATLIAGLMFDGANFGMAKKRTTAQKFGLGFLIASIIIWIFEGIQKINLANQYKKEDVKYDK